MTSAYKLTYTLDYSSTAVVLRSGCYRSIQQRNRSSCRVMHLCTMTLSQQQDDEAEKPVPHSQVSLPPTKFYAVIICLLVALLFSNGILIWRNMDSNKGREALPYCLIPTFPYLRTKASHSIGGSDKKLLRPYHWVTEFSDENKTVTSPLWESLFPSKCNK